MKLNRRRALGFLASVPVAGPAVAAEELSGVDWQVGSMVSGMGATAPVGFGAGGGYARALKLFGGVPDWMRNDWLEEAKSGARVIDPDVSALRSTSLAHKVMTQRQRYVTARERALVATSLFEDARNRWNKALWGQE